MKISLVKFLGLSLVLLSFNSNAVDIASCSNPIGKSYFPAIGLTSKKNAGWSEDGISNGITKLVKSGEDYDIQYVDIRNDIISAQSEGALIANLNNDKNFISIIVMYPKNSVEIYNFYKTNTGNLEYSYLVSRGGSGVLFSKSTIMIGKCSYINFENM